MGVEVSGAVSVKVRELERDYRLRNPVGLWRGETWFAWLLVVGGVVGVFMSGLILFDKMKLMVDSGFIPACTINDVVSCTSVMDSSQASVFGFPNPFIGLVGFAVVVTVGVGLLAGGKFRSWFWYGLLGGLGTGVVFVHWLAFESVYRIGALCPYCMVVWVVVVLLFVVTLVQVSWLRAGDRDVYRIVPELGDLWWGVAVWVFWMGAVGLLVFLEFGWVF